MRPDIAKTPDFLDFLEESAYISLVVLTSRTLTGARF
jgi:hypothetical protein